MTMGLWEKTPGLLTIAFVVAGCAASISNPAPLRAGGASSERGVEGASSSIDARRLAKILAERQRDKFGPNFSIGPGDILKVSVPGVDELAGREARVSAEGTIALPLAGVIHVGGMTEDQVRKALEARLQKYVKEPDVDVFVKEYHNRQVAVMGMVQKPGLYTLASGADTIMDMVGRAGGMKEDASAKILFIPAASAPGGSAAFAKAALMVTEAGNAGAREARSADRGVGGRAAASSAEQAEKAGPKDSKRAAGDGFALGGGAVPILRQADPIAIDLTGRGGAGELAIPARPGDVIIVPAAGQVMVDGWVQSPGAYKIGPGMTALSAVSAAGGALFSSSAQVLRTQSDGTKTAIEVDLARVKSGEEPDVPVQAGDVVFVERSVMGAAPYAFYEVFTKFGTGMYMPVP